MTTAARSVFVFGIYLVATGLVLFVVPGALLAVLRLAPTADPWIRVLGLPVGVMGAFHIAAARANIVPFFRFSVWGRAIPLAGMALLVAFRLAPPILLGLGLVDGAAALWTRAALQRGSP